MPRGVPQCHAVPRSAMRCPAVPRGADAAGRTSPVSWVGGGLWAGFQVKCLGPRKVPIQVTKCIRCPNERGGPVLRPLWASWQPYFCASPVAGAFVMHDRPADSQGPLLVAKPSVVHWRSPLNVPFQPLVAAAGRPPSALEGFTLVWLSFFLQPPVRLIAVLRE